MLVFLAENWENLQLNLIAEGLGVLTELALTYLLINYLLSKRERKKLEPSKRIIISQLAKTYSSLFNASNYTIRFTYEPSHYNNYEASMNFIDILTSNLLRLKSLIQLNSTSITSELSSPIAIFLENTDKVTEKLKYFAEIHNNKRGNIELIGETPIEELKEISEIIKDLKVKYHDIFSNSELIRSNILSVKEIEEVWREAEEKSTRIHYDPSQYKFKNGVIPMIYDVNQLRKIKHYTNGCQIALYKNHN